MASRHWILWTINFVFMAAAGAQVPQQKPLADFRDLRALMRKVRTEQIEQLKTRHIIGLELIVAGETYERLESIFGHTLLRFVDDDDDPYNDIVLSILADVDEAHESVLKGIFGGYAITTEVVPLSMFMQTYFVAEGREILRFPLMASPGQIENLKRLVIEDYIGRKNQSYFFFWRNCAIELQKLMLLAGFYPPLDLSAANAPDGIEMPLSFMFAGYTPPIRVNASYSMVDRLASAFEVSPKAVLANGPTAAMADYLYKTLDRESFAQFFVDVPLHDTAGRAEMIRLILEEKKKGPFVTRIRALPHEFYDVCTSPECGQAFARQVQEIWGIDGITLVNDKVGAALRKHDAWDVLQDPSRGNLALKQIQGARFIEMATRQ